MTLPVGRLHDFFSMSRVATIACAVVTGLLAAPTLSHAQTATIVGSLANFDVENETEDEQEGFQIELEGLELNDITRVFGKSGSTCFIRYCGGSVRSFSRPDGTFGVLVEWKATFDPIAQRFTTPPDAPGGGSSGTPSSFGAPLAPGVLTGEACWSLGSGAAYPTSGCEHFGVSTLRNPTKPPVYRWMKGDPATGIVAPDTVTTAAGAVVPAPPVAVQHPIANIVVDAKGIEQIEAVIEAPRPIDDIAPLANPRRFGKAEWVKVYKAEVPRQANLDELVGGHPNNVVPFAQPGVILPSCADVADDEPCVDIEWKLLQFDVTNQDNGSSALRSSTKSNSRSHAVIRRYEFYKYIGPVVAPGGTSGKKGERLSTDDQEQSNCLRSVPGDLTTECLSAPADEVGTFIGAQMAAQNIGPARRFAQTITGFTLPATLTFNDPPFTVSAAGGGSANPVLFAASGACTSTFGDPVITITGTGTCMVTASQDGDILFAAATPVTLTVNVEKATATVTFDAGTLSQTYSGSLKTVSATTAPVGLAVDVSITGTAQDAGDYPVTATINDDNYTGSASGTLTIAKADATFAISGFAGIYDGAAHAATGTATGVNAESLTALLNLGASFTNAPGGIANWTFAGDANYKAAAGTAAITINKATPTIAWTAPASITSGTALGAAQLNATASVPGSFVYAPAAGTLLAVGNGQLLSVTFTPADTVDYNGAAASVSIDVTAPPVSVVSIAPIVDQSNIEGDEVELQVVVIGAGRVPSRRVSGGHDGQEERGDAFSAVGLPGGLDIDNDGEIRGRIKRDTAGTYNVTVTFTHNGVRVFQTFVWRVAAGAPRRSGTRG